MKKSLAVVLFALFVPSAAFAQIEASAKDDCAKQRGHKKRVCELEIEPEELTGEAVSPNMTPLSGKGVVKHPSLIRYRREFVAKIVASADDRK